MWQGKAAGVTMQHAPSFRAPDMAVSLGGGGFGPGASTVVLLLEAAVRGGGLTGTNAIALAAFRLPYAILLAPVAPAFHAMRRINSK